MNCKERILSNDYADFILDYALPDVRLAELGYEYCFSDIDEEFRIVFLDLQEVLPISTRIYTYASIPKLYGLMQTFQADNLVETGNLQIQGPPLSLKGNGVIIGFVDTGERVIILSG